MVEFETTFYDHDRTLRPPTPATTSPFARSTTSCPREEVLLADATHEARSLRAASRFRPRPRITFTAAIQRLTHRRVVAFMSAD